jgi:hypothetical protein
MTGGEPLPRTAEREGSVLLARNEITITQARYPANR